MILVDSSVWIDYFNGVDTKETARLDDYLGSEPLLIGDIILAEVLQGFRRQRDHDRALVVLSRLAYRDLVGRQVALAAAENYRTLRRRGVTVGKTIDLLIATFCIERGHRLLYSDRDFDSMRRHLGLQTA